MSDDKVKIEIDFEVDAAAAGRIQKALDNIAKSQARVSKEFEDGNTSLKEANTRIQALNSSKQELLNIERASNAETDKANQQREEAILQEQRLTEESKSGLRAKQEQFDTVSRDVSLAGDFQSNLGAIRGLSSAAGAGGVSQALDVGGETVALVEELPRLLASAAGLPATLKASAAAMLSMGQAAAASVASSYAAAGGITGIAASSIAFLAGLGPFALVALAATAAIAGLIAIFYIFRKSSEDAKKVTEEQKEAEELSTQAATDRLGVIGEERQRLEELTAIREANGQKTDDLQDKEKELNKETEALVGVLGNGTTAINDIREAEAQLAEERTNAALEAGEDAADQAALQQEINEANTEGLNEIISTLEKRKEILEAERQALLDSGDSSEEVTARIAELDDQLGDVSEQLDTASSSASRAAAAERTLGEEREASAKEAERDAKQAAKKKAGEAKKVLQAQEKVAKDAASAANTASKKAAAEAKKRNDKLKKINEDLIKLQEKFQEESKQAVIDSKREEEKATRDANKSKTDLLKDLGRQEEDLIASGDIFAIADLREKATEDLADLRTDFDFDANERKIQRRDEATDRLREAKEQRRKLRQSGLEQFNDLKQRAGAVRGQWRSMLTGLGKDLSKFSQAIASNTSLKTNTTSGVQTSANTNFNVSIDGTPIQALVQNEISGVS